MLAAPRSAFTRRLLELAAQVFQIPTCMAAGCHECRSDLTGPHPAHQGAAIYTEGLGSHSGRHESIIWHVATITQESTSCHRYASLATITYGCHDSRVIIELLRAVDEGRVRRHWIMRNSGPDLSRWIVDARPASRDEVAELDKANRRGWLLATDSGVVRLGAHGRTQILLAETEPADERTER